MIDQEKETKENRDRFTGYAEGEEWGCGGAEC